MQILRGSEIKEEFSFVTIFFSYIHAYINYVNLALVSTDKMNMKKIHSRHISTCFQLFGLQSSLVISS